MKSFDSIQLTTHRLLIRPIATHDLKAVMKLFSDPQTMQYWSDPPMQSISQAETKLVRNIQANISSENLTLVIEDKESPGMMGQISLFNFHGASARAELGYLLSRDHWQKGLMSEALKTFIPFCFNELKLRRLEADIDPANLASARILAKMGFAKEGLLKQRWEVDGHITDSAIYGLLKSNLQ